MLKTTSLLALFIFVFLPFTSLLAARPKFPPFKERRPCKVPERCWLDAEYLFWRFKDSPEPVPLVVKGPLPSSKVVLGGKDIQTDWKSGGKLAFGYWFDNSRQLGGEISCLFIPNGSKVKTIHSDGLPGSAILSVPYFDVLSNTERFTGVALPGVFAGTAKLSLSNSLYSSYANAIAFIPCEGNYHIALLGGLRYWGFCESLSFKTNSPNIPSFPADVYRTIDHFRAENHFYGGQFGAKIEYACGCLFADVQAMLAVGTMHQKSAIKGKLLTNDFNGLGPVEPFKGGYFTMPSNIKTRKTECFAIIPELCVHIGYRVSERLKLQIGYTFLCATNVLRPGKEIDNQINPTQSAALSNTPNPILIGEAKPKSSMKSVNFYAHGLNAGFNLSF